MDFDHYRVEDLPPLSEEDAAKEYAKYYYKGRAKVTDPVLLDAIRRGNPIDPKDAIRPEQLMEVIQPGAVMPKVGYCLLPEGIAYCCSHVMLPNVTAEMRHWYMEWVYRDPFLRYAIWYPGAHGKHYRDLVMEDFGWGMLYIFQGARPSMKTLGFEKDPSEYNPKIRTVRARNARCCPVGEDINQRKGYSSMVHITFRLPDGGLELYSFSWTGAHIRDGHLEDRRGEGEVITEENGRLVLSHLIYEFSTQNEILPELYERYGQEPLGEEYPWPAEIKDNLTLVD